MKRRWMSWLAGFASTVWAPVLMAAQATAPGTNGPLNFTPPSTDFSILFLSNIFGVVDGVLAGTGSQVMGQIFGVFNSAVLTLGGIVLMYTMIVSTLNTAHEGELLGKRWSSMWIPLRSVVGVSLLMPKASGYCTMQVFVMWVVVQGVGAADKIWSAALGYLERGGTIIQPVAANNAISGTGITAGTTSDTGPSAAAIASQQRGAAIIAAQESTASSMLQMSVCLHMIQHQITAYQNQAASTGACNVSNPPWYCAPLVDLMSGVDFMTAGSSGSPSVQIPTVTQPGGSVLNGLCGTISWSAWTEANTQTLSQNVGLNIDPALMKQASQARTIAVQQMWQDIDSVGATIVANRYNQNQTGILPLGVAINNGLVWSSGMNGVAPLLSGQEISNAAAAYLGIMTPTLNALNNNIQASTSFIAGARAAGWIMAGSYFFNLASLNTTASGYANDNGTVTADSSAAFNTADLSAKMPLIFTPSVVTDYLNLIGTKAVPTANCGGPNQSNAIQTVSSFLCNANVLKSMGQVGTSAPQFVVDYQVTWTTIPYLPEKTFTGGFLNIPGISATLGYMILRVVLNLFLEILNTLLGIALDVIFKPIIMMTIPIFTNGIASALANYTNPIIALAQMGNNFINLATAVWLIALIGITVLSAIPYTGTIGVALAGLLMPFISSWMGAMFSAGATMSYYIPLMPYMLFTFGAMGWFIGVIESMVAAPIVALGITFPEGHEVYGRAEPAMMLLLNVFLRPCLMIIGFMTGIIMAYVGIWMLNAGFQSAISGLIGPSAQGVPQDELWAQNFGSSTAATSTNVTGFAAIIGIIFMIIVYIMMYITIVKTALEKLMFKFADDLLTWIGGGYSQLGQVGAEGMRAAEEATAATAGALSHAASEGMTSAKSGTKKKGNKSGAMSTPWKEAQPSTQAEVTRADLEKKGTLPKIGMNRKKAAPPPSDQTTTVDQKPETTQTSQTNGQTTGNTGGVQVAPPTSWVRGGPKPTGGAGGGGP